MGAAGDGARAGNYEITNAWTRPYVWISGNEISGLQEGRSNAWSQTALQGTWTQSATQKLAGTGAAAGYAAGALEFGAYAGITEIGTAKSVGSLIGIAKTEAFVIGSTGTLAPAAYLNSLSKNPGVLPVVQQQSPKLPVLNPRFTPNETTTNKVTAFEYLTTQGGRTPDRALQHMAGIDFTRPVSAVNIQSGTTLQQFVGKNGVGSYFAPVGTTPLQAGIQPSGQSPTIFQSNGNVSALQSFTRPDFIYPPGRVVPGSGAGNGLQYFVPDKTLLVPSPPEF